MKSLPTTVEAWLRLLLRVLGIVCLMALLAVVMPQKWIAGAHQWMGLGPFPDAPIAEYLARSTSALCAFYGGFVLILAREPRRYLPVIKYQAYAMLALSTMSVIVWLRLGMGAWWVLLDAAGGWGILLPILILAHRLEPEASSSRDSRNPQTCSPRAGV